MLEVTGNNDRIIGRLEGSMNALTKQIEGLAIIMKTFEEKNFNATNRLDNFEIKIKEIYNEFNSRISPLEKNKEIHEKAINNWKDKYMISSTGLVIFLIPFGDKVKPIFDKFCKFFLTVN